jgi:hypothetical protein
LFLKLLIGFIRSWLHLFFDRECLHSKFAFASPAVCVALLPEHRNAELCGKNIREIEFIAQSSQSSVAIAKMARLEEVATTYGVRLRQ